MLSELAPEYHVFKKIGARFLSSFAFEGGRAVQPLLAAIAVLGGIGGDRRKPLPADVPLGHLERRWSRHVFTDNSINRSYYELANSPIDRSWYLDDFHVKIRRTGYQFGVRNAQR
ncbi:hypothetical protein GOZ90_22240 [Agrobacterium vitis]|uniref:Uncharacterized protein n=1 Tax=Agrobacterium vitis TaxID=373 RepID=A0A6L6VHT9_AGRVI|nr:hypothetical protein [Agrobacterium vitis]MUZ75403.1 hypothetical protein [Agrobacterium vitis]